MFSSIPKLFGREFAMAFFLPTAACLAAVYALLCSFRRTQWIERSLASHDLLERIALFGFLCWIGAVMLLAMNHLIIRTLEGYGSINPLRLLIGVERLKVRWLTGRIASISERAADTEDAAQRNQMKAKWSRLKWIYAERYPSQEWLLPTSLGNTIRAFEIYPRIMYGIEGIQGWNRIQLVMHPEARQLVDSMKSRLDLWINLCLGALISLLVYAALVWQTEMQPIPWAPIFALGVIAFAWVLACKAAGHWGESIKACFDVFLPQLANAMRIGLGDTAEAERAAWLMYSQAIIYRAPEAWLGRTPIKEERSVP